MLGFEEHAPQVGAMPKREFSSGKPDRSRRSASRSMLKGWQ
jgi:hypothetical protein